MRLKYINGNKKNFNNILETALDKRRVKDPNKSLIVSKIIKNVKKNKDNAIIKYEKIFLKLKKIRNKDIKFSKLEIKNKIL